MDWSIQQIARLAGTTSRTLRHYDDIGLLPPSRVGDNGYRYYDRDALVRLQRILLLRDLGLGLPAVAEVLERQTDAVPALRNHLAWLREEGERLTRQIASVESTIQAMEGGEQIMAEDMLDGFEHTQYKDEVEQRWDVDAYARSDDWWRSKTPAERKEWQERRKALAADWTSAARAGESPEGQVAQDLAQRQFDWLSGIPGTPGSDTGGPTRAYLTGLGELYVADLRFGADYGGAEGATFVRDALRVYADRNL